MPKREGLNDLLGAILGSLLGGVLSALFDPEVWEYFSISKTMSRWIAFMLSGAICGWLTVIALRLRKNVTILLKTTTRETNDLKSAKDEFLQYLRGFFNNDPYALMTKETPHSGVLGTLIKDSIGKGYMKVDQVDENKYLLYLQEAIASSSCYDGIQRQPMRWFKLTTNGQRYLEVLRDRTMKSKRRVFVISDEDITPMRDDLSNGEMTEFYWRATGKCVDTYWISESDLKTRYGLNQNIDDCALYDKHLLIKYDGTKKILHFALISEKDGIGLGEADVFQKLSEQIESGGNGPFTKIQKP